MMLILTCIGILSTLGRSGEVVEPSNVEEVGLLSQAEGTVIDVGETMAEAASDTVSNVTETLNELNPLNNNGAPLPPPIPGLPSFPMINNVASLLGPLPDEDPWTTIQYSAARAVGKLERAQSTVGDPFIKMMNSVLETIGWQPLPVKGLVTRPNEPEDVRNLRQRNPRLAALLVMFPVAPDIPVLGFFNPSTWSDSKVSAMAGPLMTLATEGPGASLLELTQTGPGALIPGAALNLRGQRRMTANDGDLVLSPRGLIDTILKHRSSLLGQALGDEQGILGLLSPIHDLLRPSILNTFSAGGPGDDIFSLPLLKKARSTLDNLLRPQSSSTSLSTEPKPSTPLDSAFPPDLPYSASQPLIAESITINPITTRYGADSESDRFYQEDQSSYNFWDL